MTNHLSFSFPSSRPSSNSSTTTANKDFSRNLKLVCGKLEFALEGQLRIGRSEGVDILVRDPFVSGLHCVITNGILYDPSSTNGTFINGHQVPHKREILLRDGDLILIGDTTLGVRHTEQSRIREVRTAPAWICPFECGAAFTAADSITMRQHASHCPEIRVRSLECDPVCNAADERSRLQPASHCPEIRGIRRRRNADGQWHCPCGKVYPFDHHSIRNHRCAAIRASGDHSNQQLNPANDKSDSLDSLSESILKYAPIVRKRSSVFVQTYLKHQTWYLSRN